MLLDWSCTLIVKVVKGKSVVLSARMFSWGDDDGDVVVATGAEGGSATCHCASDLSEAVYILHGCDVRS